MTEHVPEFKPVMMTKMVEWLRQNDSEECAVWWERYWTPFHDPRRGAYTLADCGYVSCTHQNSQEGKWRPVKRGTGCGAKGDERQGLGAFMSRLVDYIQSGVIYGSNARVSTVTFMHAVLKVYCSV